MQNISKTILITGASAGFGKAAAELLAHSGHNLILVARRKEKLDELKKRLEKDFACSVYTAKVDVTKRDEVEKLFKELPEDFKNIDVLVNNAGLARGTTPAYESSLDDWEEMVDANIKGLLYFTKYTLTNMKKRDEGLIINIGSVAAIAPYPGGNVYGATKAFVKQFSHNLRADLIGTSIKVTNIEPGAAETEFSIVRFHGDEEKAKSVYANTRALTAQNIADTIKWVIDQPENVNIDTIEIMPIDQTYAGMIMHRAK